MNQTLIQSEPAAYQPRELRTLEVDPFGLDRVDPVHLRQANSTKWNEHDPDVLAAWVADMDFGVAPSVTEALRHLADTGFHGYTPYSRTKRLIEAFCNRTNRLNSTEFVPDQVRLCSDVVQAMQATIVAYTQPGDGVLLLTPLYPPFAAAIKITGRRVVEYRMTSSPSGSVAGSRKSKWTFDIAELRRLVAEQKPTMLQLCSPHNPVGRLWQVDELRQIADLAAEFDLTIVADEIHSELVFSNDTFVAFDQIVRKYRPELLPKTVMINSANKTFNLAGLKVAMVVCAENSSVEAFDRCFPGKLLGVPSTAGIVATTAALETGDAWLSCVHAYISANIDFFVAEMALKAPHVAVTAPEATYLAWLDFAALGPLVGTAGAKLLAQGRIGLNDGVTFGDGLETFARINLATSRAIVADAVERIATVAAAW